jgi:hypothetical protein
MADQIGDEDIIAGRLLWRRRSIINAPSGVRHVLLDNAANYDDGRR